MSATSHGEGWWVASDGKWYPPEQHPDFDSTARPPEPTSPGVLATLPSLSMMAETSAPPAAPEGWYPDPADPSRQRYWDGSTWTVAAPPVPPQPAAEPKRAGRGRRTGLAVAGVSVAVIVALVLGLTIVHGPAPLKLSTLNQSPQLATLQGVTCTRDGSTAVASGTVQDSTPAPITAKVLIATGTQNSKVDDRLVTINFTGGVLNASNLPWHATLSADGASVCVIVLSAGLNFGS
jgi:Protein of unknown function (DUF2510)